MAISGTERLTGLVAALRRPPVEVVIGEPFHLPSHDGSGRAIEAASAAEIIMQQIAALLPMELRGVYAEWPSATARAE